MVSLVVARVITIIIFERMRQIDFTYNKFSMPHWGAAFILYVCVFMQYKMGESQISYLPKVSYTLDMLMLGFQFLYYQLKIYQQNLTQRAGLSLVHDLQPSAVGRMSAG